MAVSSDSTSARTFATRGRVCVCALVVGLCAGGCSIDGAGRGGGMVETGRVEAGAVDRDALLPRRLVFHPLTRLARDEAGRVQIVCHFELRDGFGDAVKALGDLRVELYRPTPDAAVGAETQELVWEVSLRDPEYNALMYDGAVTRTYVVRLADAPGWVEQWMGGEGRAQWLTLRGYFTTWDGEGNERVLQATHRIQR